jgi:glutamyl-tRNA reductase
MNLLVVGINHRTAPIDVRERVAFTDVEVRDILSQTRSEETLGEVMVLSTCNRTEFYGLSKDNGAAEMYIRNLIVRQKQVDLASHPGYAYTLSDVESARHLMRVATGLDSMLLGEPQILGQVKQAHQLSVESGACGLVLNRLLHAAIIAGKRVRTETRLGGGAISVASAASELAGKIFRDLSTRSVLLIGAGEMGELTARHMLERGVSDLTIANRTFSKALELSRELDGKALPLDRVEEALVSADIVISSTGATEPIISEAQMRAIVSKRSGRPIYIIDIAVPRDFDPRIERLDGVFLHNLDAMNLLVEKGLEERRSEIPKAEIIVEEELEGFINWRDSLAATPTIKQLKEKFEEIRRQEVARYRGRFCDDDQEQLDRLTEGLMKKIIHPAMGRIRDWSGKEELGALRIDTIYELFELTHRPSQPGHPGNEDHAQPDQDAGDEESKG